MKEIVFIENLMNPKTSQLAAAVALAEAKGLRLSAVLVIPQHPEVSDFVEMHANQIKEAENRVDAYGRRMASELEAKELSFRWRSILGTGDAILEAIGAYMPADIILAGKLDFEALALKGVHNLEELSGRFHCPVLPVDRLTAEDTAPARAGLLRFALFGALSAVSYFWFFPQIDHFNHALLMKGTWLGALAVMGIVGLHAYIYGSFTEYLPRFMGLEKHGGGH